MRVDNLGFRSRGGSAIEGYLYEGIMMYRMAGAQRPAIESALQIVVGIRVRGWMHLDVKKCPQSRLQKKAD